MTTAKTEFTPEVKAQIREAFVINAAQALEEAARQLRAARCQFEEAEKYHAQCLSATSDAAIDAAIAPYI